ncbi:MAG: insulinase family protein [Oscillospiraceae bacterium]
MKYGIIINIIAGKASDLYKEMYDNSLINSTFSSDVFSGRGFLSVIFGGESRKPYEVMERVAKEIEKYKINGIDKVTFDRVKKSTYGRAIMNFNDVEDIATDMLSLHMTKNNVYDTINILAKLKLEDINELLKSSFNKDYMAISIVNPIKSTSEE